MLTDIPGVQVGHWTDTVGRTGCTVVLLPEGNVASGEIRGGAPGTREFDLLEPSRMVESINAVVLAGGSAFGLSACEGVMRWCAEQNRGYRTAHAIVPIVVGMVIYDLGVGLPVAFPGTEDGWSACESAAVPSGTARDLGAGVGATYAKFRGPSGMKDGGLGQATVRSGDVIVSALMAVNAIGDVAPDGRVSDEDLSAIVPRMSERESQQYGRENTTIGVIVTNAKLDKRACNLVAQSGHDGIGRAIWPAHLTGDGDALVAVSVPSADSPILAPVDAVRALAAEAVSAAIRNAVGLA